MATKVNNEVRVSSDLSEGEIKATQKRRGRVQTCLLEELGVHCEENNVPNIVVLGSGGGLRAMIALLGTLVELKNQNILDAVMYLCGVSGSTWCMSMLYTDSKWSEKLKSLEENLIKILTVDAWNIKKATEYLEESSEDEHYSLTDVWASCVVYKILHQFDENELTDHKDASETGINPYPIYAAVDKEKLHEKGASFPGTWFEFTPHEAGYTALGAFVSTEHFGSKFEKGKLMENKNKKKHICYMQGLWGSALGSKEEILKAIHEFIKQLLQRLQRSCETRICSPYGYDHESMSNTTEIFQTAFLLLELQLCAVSGRDPEEVFNKLLKILSEDEKKCASYQMCLKVHETWVTKTKEERIESCVSLGKEIEKEFGVCLGQEGTPEEMPRLLQGHLLNIHRILTKTTHCTLNWTWGTTNNFLYKCPNIQSSHLVKNKTISLIDAGLAINSAYPLVLRAQRQTDLILSFDFSSGDPFETIEKAAEYCQKNGIAFPKIEKQETEKESPSDCYIFRGDKSCPTVMHFPLFNKVNCSDKIKEYRSKFSTFKMSFPETDIKDLLAKAKLNVSNNSKRILQEIQLLLCSSHTNKF